MLFCPLAARRQPAARPLLPRVGVVLLSLLACASLAPITLAQPAASRLTSPATQEEKSISIVEAIEAIPAAQRPPNRFALLIGVDEYTDKAITRLDACVRDVTALADVLTDPQAGMFPPTNVTVLTNQQVTRRNVMSALSRLAQQAGPNDLVVVFFSGHGWADGEGRGYWIMHDTEIAEPAATALSRLDIDDRLKKIATNRLVTIIDACHAAATAEVGKTKATLNLDTILPQFDGDGRVAFMSSDANQLSVTIPKTANHPGAGHSAFAWHIIEGLRGAAADENGVVTVDGLWDFVSQRTEVTARQQGGSQRPRKEGTTGGRFLLGVNAERMRQRALEQQRSNAQTQARIATIRTLGVEGKISIEHAREGQELLQTPPETLDQARKGRLKVYTDLAEGRLAPEYLEVALGKFPLTPPRAVPAPQPVPVPAPQPAPEPAPKPAPQPSTPAPVATPDLVATIAPLRTLSGHSSFVLSAAFSPDGRFIVTASLDGTAIVWDAASGQRLRILSGHIAFVRSAAFSPDGRFIVTGSDDNTAIVWDAASGQRLRTLSGHSGSVYSAAFSPDGRFIVTGSWDDTAIVWDAASGQRLRTLSGHSNDVKSAAFSPDGRFIVTASWDKTAKIWPFTP